MVFGRLLSSCLALMLLCGCDSGGHRTAAPDKAQPTTELRIETPATPRALPPEMCFVGVHDYAVMLLGQQLESPTTCSRLADRFFPGAKHLPWSAAEIENPDLVAECVLSRASGRLSVARGDPDRQGPRFERAYDLAERACESLRGEGWKDTPISEW